MSAFQISAKHVNALIDAAIHECARYGVRWYDDRVTRANATEVGAALLNECAKSVAYRYNEEPDTFDGEYEWKPIDAPLGYVALLKLIDCYEYQSCEHPGWNTSQAKEFCDRLRKALIGLLPGYAEANWGIS